MGAFVSFLKGLASEERLNKWVLYPTSDMAVYVLSKHRDVLDRAYLLPTSEWEVTQFAYDKRLSHQLAEQLKVPVPKTWFPENIGQLSHLDLDFPVILKPTIKENFFPVTKKKAIRANNKDDLIQAHKYMSSIIDRSEIMVQELIQGGANNLYSFCCLFGDGVAKAKVTARRPRQHPMEFGNCTTFAHTCDVPEIEEYAVRMLSQMHYYGLCEVEFMYDNKDGKLKFLEINPRTWGWHTLGSKAGVNFSALLFMDINNKPVSANSFERNVKWIRLLTDMPIIISEICRRRLKLIDYLHSLKGKKEFAVFSSKDPLPFIMEILSAPYLWYKRGF